MKIFQKRSFLFLLEFTIVFTALAVFLLACTLKNDQSAALYQAIYTYDVDSVSKILASGWDPKRCSGDARWIDSDPLTVLIYSVYDTYYRDDEKVPKILPDEAIFANLIESGADINHRPYIWLIVHLKNANSLENLLGNPNKRLNLSQTDELTNHTKAYVSNENRVLKIFLNAGANVDSLGDPYPFSREVAIYGINDEKANEYFVKGTRAINEVIQKGMIWESTVDLLLKHTKLDDESLRAAERSNDPRMIEKITKLWIEQQGK
jgi:hypothetical protein